MSLFKQRPLALVLLSFILSSLLTSTLYTHASGGLRLLAFAPLLLAFSFCMLAILRHKRGHLLLLSALLIALAIGPLSQILYYGSVIVPLDVVDTGRVHTLTGTVEAVEGIRRQKAVYTVRTETVDEKAEQMTLRLYVDADEAPLQIGNEIRFDATVSERGNSYLYSHGVSCSISAVGAVSVTATGENGVSLFGRWQALLAARFNAAMEGEAAPLFSAVLLGDRAALPANIRADFRRAGLSHVLALSGLHLSVLAIFLLKALRKLSLPRWITLTVFLLFLFLYAAIAGFPLSLLRASGMLALTEIGRLLRLRADPITSLLISVSLIIAVSPPAITDVGLWLSFLATLGILTGEGIDPPTPRKRILRFLFGIGSSLLSTCLALCFTTLLTAITFGGTSLIALPANLLIAPLIHAILLLGPFVLLFPTVLGGLAERLSELTLSTVEFISDLRGIYLPTNTAFLIASIAMSGVTLVLALISLKKRRIYWLTSVGALLLSFAILFTGHTVKAQTSAMYYVSQNSSEYLLIRSRARTTLVAKSGTPEALSRLESTLKEQQIGDIDTLIMLATNGEGDEFLSTLAEGVCIHSLYVASDGDASDPDLLAAATALSLAPAPLPRHAVFDGDVECAFRGELTIRGETEDGFLLKLYLGDTAICLTSAATLTDIGIPEREAFLQNADLLLALRMHSPRNLIGLTFPEDATVILTQTGDIPADIARDPRIFISPREFTLPLK